MTYQLDILLDEIASNAKTVLGVETSPSVEIAQAKFDADYAIPCFAFARELQISPQDIAKRLSETLKHKGIQKMEAIAGFLNIWLKADQLARDLAHELKRPGSYGESDEYKGKTAIVEFPSPNMAKPFSVGHLRPAVQGWAVKQLLEAVGYRVITDNHLGNWGTPFGKWVVGFRHYSSEEALKSKGIYELARVYIQITDDLKVEKATGGHTLADEVQEWLLKLEKDDPEALAYSKRFADVSLRHMHKIMERLGILTDYEYGEAFYISKGKRMVSELVEKGVADKQADGSIIVRLDEYGIDTPILLEKSNGAALYATSDLATLKFRIDTWHPDLVVYVVAAEQQFHFKQLFALADKLKYRGKYVHYWFGLVDQVNDDGTRSKMSSRKGVVLLEELLDIAEQKARERAIDPDILTQRAVEQIALGAIKFTDFAQDKKTSVLFDWDRIFNLQGFSGPYVQYAAVRVGAILKKFGTGDWQGEANYDWHAERNLLIHIARYPQIVKQAAEQYEPHRIAQYIYELARILNRYYEVTPVGNTEEELRELRLWLLGIVQNNFVHALSLLGIEVPEKM